MIRVEQLRKSFGALQVLELLLQSLFLRSHLF